MLNVRINKGNNRSAHCPVMFIVLCFIVLSFVLSIAQITNNSVYCAALSLSPIPCPLSPIVDADYVRVGVYPRVCRGGAHSAR